MFFISFAAYLLHYQNNLNPHWSYVKNEISLKLLNENTILIKDKNNKTAKVTYIYPKIILEYENHIQQTFHYKNMSSYHQR